MKNFKIHFAALRLLFLHFVFSQDKISLKTQNKKKKDSKFELNKDINTPLKGSVSSIYLQ